MYVFMIKKEWELIFMRTDIILFENQVVRVVERTVVGEEEVYHVFVVHNKVTDRANVMDCEFSAYHMAEDVIKKHA